MIIAPEELKRLVNLDFEHVWHPFTQTVSWISEEPLIIEWADGCELIDVNGKKYLDGVSSLWCNVHGHGKEEIVFAILNQAKKLCHSTLLGLSHRPLLELTEKLLNFFPDTLTRIFYADSGSAAVEAALRMALEYWQHQPGAAAKKRTKLLSLEEAYHGDTLGAVGVGYSNFFHAHLSASIIPALRFTPPHLYRVQDGADVHQAEVVSLEELRAVLEESGEEIAALIVEPLMQGAAGMWYHSPKYLREVVKLCRSYGILIIMDEVATGFGKTGEMFASSIANIVPDIMVLGKGLTGGYLPLSAAITTSKVFEAFSGPPEAKNTFFYGQTFAGNPLAAAAALANLKLFEEEGFFDALAHRLGIFGNLVEKYIESLPNVSEVRRLGVMTGIELTATPGQRRPFPPEARAGDRIVHEARLRGVFVRPIGNVLTLMPAIAMKEEELLRLVKVTAASISAALDG